MGLNWLAHLGIQMLSGDGQQASTFFERYDESLWQGTYPHDNPRFYKSKWKVFTAEHVDPENDWWEQDVPWLSLAVAMERISLLHAAGTQMLIRNDVIKRIGPETPWNDASIIRQERWAPAYDDDPDPIWHGHK